MLQPRRRRAATSLRDAADFAPQVLPLGGGLVAEMSDGGLALIDFPLQELLFLLVHAELVVDTGDLDFDVFQDLGLKLRLDAATNLLAPALEATFRAARAVQQRDSGFV